MPNERRVDGLALVGAVLVGGAIGWFLFRPRNKTKFKVGDRVALKFQVATEGTVIQVQPLTDSEQFYVVQFDNIAGPSIVTEADLIAA